jgi:hypothetical protein
VRVTRTVLEVTHDPAGRGRTEIEGQVPCGWHANVWK